MNWTFTTEVINKRRDGLPARGGKISIVFDTDETSPNELVAKLYHGKTLYTEGNISVAASIIPLSAIVEELEAKDEVGLSRGQMLRQTQQWVKVLHLLENSEKNGATARFNFILETPGSVAH